GDGSADPARMADAIVRRYDALVEAYGPFPYVQLDNEADGGGPYAVSGGDPAAQGAKWGRVMRLAGRRIKERHPGTRIVSAGLAWNREGVREWTRAMVREAGSALDVLAIHVYGIGCA